VRLQIRDRLDAVAVVEPVPPRRRWDWVLTALLALAALVPITLDVALPLWARIIPAVLAVGFIPFRRHIPLVALTVVSTATAVCLALALRGPEVVDGWLAPAGLAYVVLIYSLCRWATPLHVGIGFIVSVGSEIIIEWASGDPQVYNLILVLPWFFVAGFALAMRYRARAIEGRHDQVRLAERNSLARELHDTVAHHVTAIAVQAQAGQYVVESNPGAAAEVLKSIETIANESIDEMRRMVGILRSEDEHTRTVAPDTLDVLAVREGRPTVHVSGDTRLDVLPAGVGAALFRIAQESITNARRHSRDVTFVDVAVKRHGDRVQMTIDNDGTPTTRNSGSGFGQVGMRERVEALGGVFESSARPALGWRTATSIPLARVDQ
jgi:signal transduction histidine kinase